MRLKNYQINIILSLIFLTCFDFGLRFTVEIYYELRDEDYRFDFKNIIPFTRQSRSTMKLLPYLVFQGNRDNINDPDNQTLSRQRYYRSELVNHNANNVLLLGGSVVENMSINLDQLERMTSQQGLNYEFINGGWSAYNSIQEFILLSQIIDEIQPETVILFDGFNDIWLSLYENYPPGYPQHFRRIETINDYVDHPYRAVLFDLADRIYPVRLVLSKLKKMRIKKNTNTELPKKLEEISFYYNRSIKNIALLCKTNNTRLIVIHQPSIFTKNNLSDKEIEWTNAHNLIWSFKEVYLQAWDIMKNQTKMLSIELGFEYYDWSNIFNNTSETIFLDVVHFQSREDKDNIANTILIDSLRMVLIQ